MHDLVAPTCRRVRATIVSMTAPRSSFRRCTSSIMRSFTFWRQNQHQNMYVIVHIGKGRPTEASSPSPVGFRVTTSHFSGVVTMICVSLISCFVSCMSPAYDQVNDTRSCDTVYIPVSSRTRTFNHFSRFPIFRVISAASAFMGALDMKNSALRHII